MKIVQTTKGDCSICEVDGEINLNTSPELRKSFDGLVKSGIKKIIIDFSKVPYIDSSGLATLIELLQRLKKSDGKLRICSVSEKVKNIFDITKLHKLFDIHDDQESARESF